MGCKLSIAALETGEELILFGHAAGFDKLLMDGNTVSGNLEVPEGILVASWKWVCHL